MYVKGPEKETIEKLMREAAEALPVSGETELQVVVRFLFVCFLMCLFVCLFLCLFVCLITVVVKPMPEMKVMYKAHL